MSNDKTLATAKHGGCVQLGTPGSRWAASGEPDPNGTRYDCERAALVMGDLTDDELANAVFMHGNERQTMADLVGGATPAIAYLTAAKDRIRWLSRALAAAESLSAQPSPGGQDALDTLIDQWMARADRHEASAIEADSIGGMQMAVAVHEARAAELNAAVHSLKEALADRKPVEVSEGGFRAAASRQTASAESNATAEALMTWARQPVGEPVGTVHSGKYASGMPWCEVEWHIPQPAGTKLYAAPPAQAVDLGPFRSLARSWIVEAGGTVADTKHACADELLALIDSQAVGNG